MLWPNIWGEKLIETIHKDIKNTDAAKHPCFPFSFGFRAKIQKITIFVHRITSYRFSVLRGWHRKRCHPFLFDTFQHLFARLPVRQIKAILHGHCNLSWDYPPQFHLMFPIFADNSYIFLPPYGFNNYTFIIGYHL